MGRQQHGQDGGQALQDGREGKDFEGKVDVFLLDLMSTVQREAIERMKRSQVMEQNNDKNDEAIVQGAGVLV